MLASGGGKNRSERFCGAAVFSDHFSEIVRGDMQLNCVFPILDADSNFIRIVHKTFCNAFDAFSQIFHTVLHLLDNPRVFAYFLACATRDLTVSLAMAP